MTSQNEWVQQAEALKAALTNKLLPAFLKSCSQSGIAQMAGGEFAELPENEQASIIKMLLDAPQGATTGKARALDLSDIAS